MRVALVNPRWRFDGSVYFGCREPHLPLEYGYARALLARAGHDARLFDAALHGTQEAELTAEVARFAPDMIVVTTAPSYLFWRCAPPELTVPWATLSALRGLAERTVAVGPHASTTPRAVLRKLEVDAAVLGECEEVIVELAGTPRARWGEITSIALRDGDVERVQGAPRAAHLTRLPALAWERELVAAHRHHHHRFDAPPDGPGAEVEATRGCPYHCTFCAKEAFRDDLRRRPLRVVLDEIDALLAQGVRYLYFIDEIFLPQRPLLEALAARDVAFGVQLRIDGWSRENLDLLGRAGCVSIEAGVESVTEEGRSLLAKRCRATTAHLTDLLVHAKSCVPFVQANLLDAKSDPPDAVRAFRDALLARGVWTNEPVPMFPYPGSPAYTARWGAPDDAAWERAHAHYLGEFERMSDLQAERPLSLPELERRRDDG